MSTTSLLDRAQAYVGTRYVPGEFDCADLAERVLAEVFGRHVCLPHDRPQGADARTHARQIARMKSAVAIDRAGLRGPDALWCAGDGVLLAVGRVPTHIGVLFGTPTEWWVLHNDDGAHAAVLTRLRQLPLIGFRLEGVYAWR